MTHDDPKIQPILPQRATTVHDHPKNPENLMSWLSPLQNDKDPKTVKHLIDNGSGHHRSADFLSGDDHEIRFFWLFWVIVNGGGSSWEYWLYFWVIVGHRGFVEIINQHISPYDVTV